MSEEKTFSIAIIDDDPIVRESLQTYFTIEKACKYVWSAESMESFFELLDAGETADVILTDIGLPGMSGIEGIRIVREKLKEADIIMLTVFKDDNRIFKSLCAGATGYLLKDTPFEQVLEAIHIIREGGSFMSPAIARKVVSYFNPPVRSAEVELTTREQQIIIGLRDGLSYKLIADRLSISIDTIRYHIKKIYTKLQVNSRTELINKSINGDI